MRLRSFIPLVLLLLVGCRSERVAFLFAPGKTTYERAPEALTRSTDVNSTKTRPAPAITAAQYAIPVPGTLTRHAPRPEPQRSSLGQRLTLVSTKSNTRPAASTTSLGGRYPAERALLISGGVSTAAGLLINNLVSSSASMGLLSLGYYLLLIGTLLLLAWFILLLLRAVKE